MLVTVAVAWLGLYAHNVADLPRLTLLSPENSLTALVWSGLLALWWLRPGRSTIWLLSGHAWVQMIGGALSVLPLPFLPFAPEQTLYHYGFHVLYAVAQLPVLLAMRASLWAGPAAAPLTKR